MLARRAAACRQPLGSLGRRWLRREPAASGASENGRPLWCSPSTELLTTDRLVQRLQEIRRANPQHNYEIHVGSDSQSRGERVSFSSVVALYRPGRGALYWYRRCTENKRQYAVLQTRLLHEVCLSVGIAELLRHELELGPAEASGIAVHCDSATNPASASYGASPMLRGYITGMGYEARLKPDSWASFVADRHA